MSLGSKFTTVRNFLIEVICMAVAWFVVAGCAYLANMWVHYAEEQKTDKVIIVLLTVGEYTLAVLDTLAIIVLAIWFFAELVFEAWTALRRLPSEGDGHDGNKGTH